MAPGLIRDRRSAGRRCEDAEKAKETPRRDRSMRAATTLLAVSALAACSSQPPAAGVGGGASAPDIGAAFNAVVDYCTGTPSACEYQGDAHYKELVSAVCGPLGQPTDDLLHVSWEGGHDFPLGAPYNAENPTSPAALGSVTAASLFRATRQWTASPCGSTARREAAPRCALPALSAPPSRPETPPSE